MGFSGWANSGIGGVLRMDEWVYSELVPKEFYSKKKKV